MKGYVFFFYIKRTKLTVLKSTRIRHAMCPVPLVKVHLTTQPFSYFPFWLKIKN